MGFPGKCEHLFVNLWEASIHGTLLEYLFTGELNCFWGWAVDEVGTSVCWTSHISLSHKWRDVRVMVKSSENGGSWAWPSSVIWAFWFVNGAVRRIDLFTECGSQTQRSNHRTWWRRRWKSVCELCTKAFLFSFFVLCFEISPCVRGALWLQTSEREIRPSTWWSGLTFLAAVT